MSSDEDEIIKEELENENALDLRVSNSSTLPNKDTKRLKNDNSLYDNLDNIAIKNLNNLNTNYLFQHFQKLLNNYTNNDYNNKNSNNNNNSNKNNDNCRYEYSASSSNSPITPPPLSVPPIHSPPKSRRSSQISSPNNIPLLQSWDPYKQYYYYLMNSSSFANNHHLAEAMMETYNNLLTSSSPSVSPLIIDQKRDLHHAHHYHHHPSTYSNNNTNGNNNNHHQNHQSNNSNNHSLHHGLRQSIFALKNDKEFRYAEDGLNLNQTELHLLSKFNKGYNCHTLNKKLIYRKDVDNISNGNEDEEVCREKEDEEEVESHHLLHNEVDEDEDEDNETGDDDLENGGSALDLRVSNLSMPSKKDYKPQIDKNSKLSKHYLIQHFQKFFVKRSSAENAKNENIYCHQTSSPSPPPLPKYAIERDAMANNYVNNLLSPSLLVNHNHNNINSNNNNNRHHNLTNTFQINQRVFLNELKNDLKDLQYQNSIYSDDLNSKTELRSADTTKQGLSDLNGDRKRISRPLTGRHVRQGTGASPSTLMSLRQMIQDRQKLKELGIPGTQGKTKRRNGKRK